MKSSKDVLERLYFIDEEAKSASTDRKMQQVQLHVRLIECELLLDIRDAFYEFVGRK